MTPPNEDREAERVFTPFAHPEPRTVQSRMRSGCFGVKSMEAVITGKTAVKDRYGTFTILHVEAKWPFSPTPMKMDFAADDSLSLGQVREWRLTGRTILKGAEDAT